MAQEHVDKIEKAIEVLLQERRDYVDAIAAGDTNLDYLTQLVSLQSAIDVLLKSKIDEEARLPSVYETRGIRSF
jgi:cell division septum initiation protein DivIVA